MASTQTGCANPGYSRLPAGKYKKNRRLIDIPVMARKPSEHSGKTDTILPDGIQQKKPASGAGFSVTGYRSTVEQLRPAPLLGQLLLDRRPVIRGTGDLAEHPIHRLLHLGQSGYADIGIGLLDQLPGLLHVAVE